MVDLRDVQRSQVPRGYSSAKAEAPRQYTQWLIPGTAVGSHALGCSDALGEQSFFVLHRGVAWEPQLPPQNENEPA